MKDIFNFEDKTVVVTGGAGILCSTVSVELAKRGAEVVILDLMKKEAQQVVNDIKENGGEAIAIKTDVLNNDSLIKAKEEMLEKYGKVDILINGAGGNKKEATTGEDKSFFDLSYEAMHFVVNLNLFGTILPTQIFGKLLVEQKSGCIINFSSLASMQPPTRVIGYAAAKAAVNNFTKWLSVYINENYSENVRVNAIAPGYILTKQNHYLLKDEETGEDTTRGENIRKSTPMNRYGRPEELISTILWLASDASSFVNGTVVTIDGGFSAFSGV